MFKRIIRAVKNGILKTLPFGGFVNDIRDIKVREIIRQVRAGSLSLSGKHKQDFYKIADLLDDGKLNESVKQDLFDTVIEFLIGAGTVIATGKILWNYLGL